MSSQSSISTPLPPKTAFPTIASWIVDHGGRLMAGDETKIEGEFGSRLAFRLWGLYTKRLPMRVHVNLVQVDDVLRVDVGFRSDEGKYLMRIEAATLAYRQRFDELLSDLEARLSWDRIDS